MFEKIKSALAEQLGIEEDQIKMESNLVEDLNADSLDLVQLLMVMESDYGMTFTDDQIRQIKTIADIIKFMEEEKK
ncbi:MAG: acyl carrier protein [Clostridia bacterium]